MSAQRDKTALANFLLHCFSILELILLALHTHTHTHESTGKNLVEKVFVHPKINILGTLNAYFLFVCRGVFVISRGH